MQWFVVVAIPFGAMFLWEWAKKNIDSEQVNFPDLKLWDLQAFILAGFVGAFAGALYIAMVSIPMAASLTLQFRRGVLRSLRDKEFLVYRKVQDTRTMVRNFYFAFRL
jgi:H+/Cl- antiporter ClcA